MRICFFGDACSPHIQSLAGGLAQNGNEVHVVSHKPYEIPGVFVNRLEVPPPSFTNPRRWTARRERYLGKLVRSFEIVNMHFLSDWGFSNNLIDEGCFVASPWGSDIVDPPGETPAGPELLELRRNILRRASAVTACGASFARAVEAFASLQKDSVQVIPFGVNLQLFDPDRFPNRCGSDPQRVGFFKGFREVYGATDLVRAIPYTLQECPRTEFEFVGDGAQLDTCKKMADELDVTQAIRWIPRQRHSHLPARMRGWDVCVVPSIRESFGVAILESSAMRIPVVASDVGGLRDTVQHELTGVLVPPKNPRAIADAITRLLKNPERGLAMGQAGRHFVAAHFDWQHLHQRWIKLYEAAVERATISV